MAYGYTRKLCNRFAQIAAVLIAIWGSFVAAEEATVVVLGDSLAAGYGLTPEAGLVPQLENWLTTKGIPVSLLNAGVSGDTTAGGLARLDWALVEGTDALIVELGANDMLRGIDPANTRENLNAILEEASTRGLPVLLIGFQAAGNFGSEYKQAFDSIYPELSAQYDALLMPSFFASLVEGSDAGSASKFMQADGMHPNPAGIAILVEEIGPFVEDLLERVGKN